MVIGPLEIAVLGVEREGFVSDIAPALVCLQRQGAVRIVDMVVVAKDSTGGVSSAEIENLNDAEAAGYHEIASDMRGLLTEDDVANVALELPASSRAMILLLEHSWGVELEEAVIRTGGRLLGQTRISPLVVNELAEELEAALAG